MHLAQSRRDRDELTNARYKASDKSADLAVVIEIGFRFLHFLAAQETQVSEFAVCKGIDDCPSQPEREQVVDNRAEHSAYRTEKDDQRNIDDIVVRNADRAVRILCHIRSRRDDHFAGERNERTLNGHQRHDRAVVHMSRVPVGNGGDPGGGNLRTIRLGTNVGSGQSARYHYQYQDKAFHWANSSRTLRLIALPSALPASCLVATPMTLPMSCGPVAPTWAMISLSAAVSSSSLNIAGR